MKKITESSVEIYVPENHEKPQRSEVFYNPRMTLNRDISVASAKAYFGNKKIEVCDPFCATGIRAVRYAKELNAEVFASDISHRAVKLTEKNAKLNKVKINVFRENANKFLFSNFFDLIDLDPFGTPAPFFEAAVHSVKNRGMLGITATDATALCGVKPKVCLRNYGAVSLRTEYCHEIAIRILLGAVARAATKFEKAIKPLLVLNDQHYFRLQIKVEHGAEKANKCLENIGFVYHCPKCGARKVERGFIAKSEKCSCGAHFKIAGPLWIGKLFDKKFCKKVLGEDRGNKKLEKLLNLMIEEANAPALYYNVHKTFKGASIPKIEHIIKKLKEKGFKATRTHFNPLGIKTNAPINKIREIK